MNTQNQTNVGLFYGMLTFTMWGLFPAYFKLLDHINPLEILIHRIIWSFVFLACFILALKKTRNLFRFLHIKKVVLTLMLSGLLISTNWGIYIYAVTTNQILESALGYFINPLMSILLGVIFLKESPSFATKISIALVFIAILVQIYALGKIPFVSLVLPMSFALYGLIRKKLSIPSIEGLFIETMLLFPISLIVLVIFTMKSQSHLELNLDGFLLAFSGLVTIVPLLTFNLAAIRLKLTTIGFLQYTSPTLAIFLAVFVYGESLNIYKIMSFTIIWLGIIIVTVDGMKKSRQRRKVEH